MSRLLKKKYTIDMTKGNLFVQILVFALPLMASSVLQLLFNAADIIVVGKFAGDECLAAVSSTGSLCNLLVTVFIGISIGTNVTVARYIGARREEQASKAIHTSITMSFFFGLLVAVVGFFFARTFLLMMGSPDNVIDLSTLYLKIYFLGAPFNLLYNFGSAVLRSRGDTQRPLFFLTIAGITNVALNLLLVIVFKMSVAGVAIATITSQFISAFLVINCLRNEEGNFKLVISQLGIDKESLLDILRVGIPCGMQSLVFALSNVIIQSSVNTFGSVVMAGNGAAANVEGFVFVIMDAFCQACQTFISQNLGSRNLKRIKSTLAISFLYVSIFGCTVGIGGWYFGKYLLAIYSDSPAVIEAGLNRMYYYCRTYATCGMMNVFVAGSRGLGVSVPPMICSFIFTCALRVLWIKLIFDKNPTIFNLYISYPLSWIFTGIFQAIIYAIVYNRTKKRIEAELAEEN